MLIEFEEEDGAEDSKAKKLLKEFKFTGALVGAEADYSYLEIYGQHSKILFHYQNHTVALADFNRLKSREHLIKISGVFKGVQTNV